MTPPSPEPDAEPPPAPARGARGGLAGYGCLLIGATGGLLGGGYLAFLAVSRIVAGARAELAHGADAAALTLSLEGAVIAAGFGALLLLIGFVCGVVLLKELADDAARARRGPL